MGSVPTPFGKVIKQSYIAAIAIKASRKVAALLIAIARNWRARRYGIGFGRISHSRLPAAITANGKIFHLAVPDTPNMRSAFAEILLDDCYGIIGQSADRILDIGANVGLFSLAARIACPAAVIHAYEPNEELAPYLNAQSKTADFLLNYEAVGRVEGWVSLIRHPDPLMTASQQDDQGPIRQVALWRAIERLGGRVDFLKVDCEGAEWNFLADVDALRRVKRLAMEYHLVGQHSEQDLRRLLVGFDVIRHVRRPGYGLLWAINVAQ